MDARSLGPSGKAARCDTQPLPFLGEEGPAIYTNFFFKLVNYFILFCLAAGSLLLHWPFWHGSGGRSLIAVHKLLIAVASLLDTGSGTWTLVVAG